ncbi:hypothetical protein SKAU_G00056790 [Synaphobranchus kaupii]|uniref:Uncharacterized protein n=1 Tax=Synaphobranchus kaupii TaxID=118154 RepID=A0A9Q1G554_SYNKA|nr:hypothetical protein SKAU_G00056790 [Synaphobranchus kaupii]
MQVRGWDRRKGESSERRREDICGPAVGEAESEGFRSSVTLRQPSREPRWLIHERSPSSLNHASLRESNALYCLDSEPSLRPQVIEVKG